MNGDEWDLDAPPDEGDDFDDRIQRMLDLLEAGERQQVLDEIDDILAGGQQILQNIINNAPLLQFNAPIMFNAQRRPTQDPGEDTGADSDPQRLAAAPPAMTLREATDKLKATLDYNGAFDGVQGSKRAEWNAVQWLLLAGLPVPKLVGILFEEAARVAMGHDDADVPLPDDMKASVRALMANWTLIDDTEFWGRLAKLVDANQSHLASVVYFTQYAAAFFPLPEPLIWDKSADKMAVVMSLRDTYLRQGRSIGAVLGRLSTLSYKGVPLERYAQASCASLAFAILCDEERGARNA